MTIDGSSFAEAPVPEASTLTFDDIVRPFAETVFIKVGVIRSGRLNRTNVGHVKESIRHELRKCSDILLNTVRGPEVSEGADAQARALGIDLRTQSWGSQPRFDPGRVLFLLEHVIPVRTLQESALKAVTADEVLEMLRANMRVAWILKSEDRELTRLGFRTLRPDPEAAYEAAGIRLLRA